jgi:NACalpha-BTF3-like transcription factor
MCPHRKHSEEELDEDNEDLLDIPSELVEFIASETGFPEHAIRRVLEAERRYYLSLIINQ